MDDYATIFLFILVLACICILLNYLFVSSTQSSSTQSSGGKMEGFLDYQDVKTKTMNWCDKMQKAGLLSADQFNQCISSFKDTTAGIVSSGLGDDSKYGMGMDYSLYNTREKELSSSVANSTSGGGNTIMILLPSSDSDGKGNKGLALACKPDGSLYLVANVDDPQVNQKELYFTLEQINETAFAIISPYGAFLVADNTYSAGFTGKSMGPLSAWNIIKMTNSTSSISNISQVMIESTQFPGFHLVIDKMQNILSIQQGRNDSMIWSISPKANNDSSALDNRLDMNVSQYTVLKENILTRFKNYTIRKLTLEASIDTIKKLQTAVSNNYADITNYIQTYLQNQQRIYQLSSSDYKTRSQSIRNNSMIDPDTQQNLINNLPQIQGLNITTDIITQVLTAINNQKNTTLQYINNNALMPLQQQLAELNSRDTTLVDYNKFIGELQTELQATNDKIIQNHKILARQKDKYNAINSDYSYQLKKIDKLEKVDKIAELNVGLLSGYQAQKGYLTKIYPVCIFFLVIGLLYLSYLTYIKFIDNVWSQYKD